MMLTGEKQQVLDSIRAEVSRALMNGFSNLQYTQMNSVNTQMAFIIEQAITAGFSKYIEKTYTNEEFERDLGLKT